MPIRMTGINSGMDTESIISELVKAKSVKKDKLVKAQTKLQWKQDAWKELNSKVYGFYTKTLSNMRLESDYSKKNTKLSDESAATIVTGSNAVNGVQELRIEELAKSGYLTGGKIEDKEGRLTSTDGMAVKPDTTLDKLGITDGSELLISLGSGEIKKIEISSTDTIEEVENKLKDTGIAVEFDENRQRFVTSNTLEEGKTTDFQLLSWDIGSKLGLDSINKARSTIAADTTLYQLGITGESSFTVKIGNGEKKEIKLQQSATLSDVVTQLKEAGLNANFDEKNQRFFISSKESGTAGNFELGKGTGELLSCLGLDYHNTSLSGEMEPHKVTGTDARIMLNDATFTSNTNTFEINGLTITANKKTDPAAPVTITTTQDTDGIYGMIKNFLKEYNTIINELDSLYNADSSKGYEPLTDEEKEAMSEKEVEKWEEKIKKSILRKDETVDKVGNAMKSIMMQGVNIGGVQMYLSDFGINTLGYFNAPKNEKNAYHIDGDSDDENTANNADKLKAMIASNPDKVVDFFSNLSKNLYDKVGDMMKKTDYSSSFTLYDDVLMKKEYDDYKNQIADQEKKITAFEDRYYDKFSAMETAMAKLQSKESAIAGLLNY